jgi:hypothetical protein
MNIKLDELIEPLGTGLKAALKDVVEDATDPELTAFTIEVATTGINIAALPDGPDKEALLKEYLGTLRIIAERHRIKLAAAAQDQLHVALNTGIAIISKIALTALG